MYSGLVEFFYSIGAKSDVEFVAASIIIVPIVVILSAIIAEGIKAYQETAARQRRLHPDPEAERELVNQLLQIRQDESNAWRRPASRKIELERR